MKENNHRHHRIHVQRIVLILLAVLLIGSTATAAFEKARPQNNRNISPLVNTNALTEGTTVMEPQTIARVYVSVGPGPVMPPPMWRPHYVWNPPVVVPPIVGGYGYWGPVSPFAPPPPPPPMYMYPNRFFIRIR